MALERRTPNYSCVPPEVTRRASRGAAETDSLGRPRHNLSSIEVT